MRFELQVLISSCPWVRRERHEIVAPWCLWPRAMSQFVSCTITASSGNQSSRADKPPYPSYLYSTLDNLSVIISVKFVTMDT